MTPSPAPTTLVVSSLPYLPGLFFACPSARTPVKLIKISLHLAWIHQTGLSQGPQSALRDPSEGLCPRSCLSLLCLDLTMWPLELCSYICHLHKCEINFIVTLIGISWISNKIEYFSHVYEAFESLLYIYLLEYFAEFFNELSFFTDL